MSTVYLKKFKGLSIFCKAFSLTRHEMYISLQILLGLTLILSLVMYLAESSVNPDYSYWDALLWIFIEYVQDPAGITESPVTVVGMIAGTIVGYLGVGLFAVPAGLVGSGFIDAMTEEKREKEIEEYHNILLRSQRLTCARNFQTFLKTLPQDENAWYYGCSFKYIPNNTRISKYLLKGIDLKDIIDVCRHYPEFRVKNRATALSMEEENKNDVYLLEHFPVNTVYGCFINRGSKVTIVSTSSRSELDTGNFSFYLAKFAGFNYISKDFDADPESGESYYNNIWSEPEIDGKTLEERKQSGEKISKSLRDMYKCRKSLREEFLHDLESVATAAGTWVICILNQVPNKTDKTDIHVTHNTENGAHETINELETYNRMLEKMTTSLRDKLGLTTEESTRYPLLYRSPDGLRNLVYKLHEDNCRCNGLTMRISSHIMEFDADMRIANFLIASAIKDAIEPTRQLPPDDVEDMNRTGYGFRSGKEQNVEQVMMTGVRPLSGF